MINILMSYTSTTLEVEDMINILMPYTSTTLEVEDMINILMPYTSTTLEVEDMINILMPYTSTTLEVEDKMNIVHKDLRHYPMSLRQKHHSKDMSNTTYTNCTYLIPGIAANDSLGCQ